MLIVHLNFDFGTSHTKAGETLRQITLAILKPDCVQKKLTGKVINHLLQAGFEIIGLKMVRLNRETAGEFYAVHKGRPFYADLTQFMSEGKIIILALEKENAVDDLRELIGSTDPAQADEGTVRKLFADSKSRNIIHASDSAENAKIEIGFFFTTQEIIENR